MKISFEKKALELLDVDFVVKFCYEKQKHLNNDLEKLLELNCFTAELGKTLILNRVAGFQAKRLLIVGVDSIPMKSRQYLKAINSAISVLNEAKAKSVAIEETVIIDQDEFWIHKIIAFAFENSNYKIAKVGLEIENTDTIESINICSKSNQYNILNEGIAMAKGVAFAKKLADMPANICTPNYLADAAISISNKYNLECEILEEKQMQDLGMNSLLSVSKGSVEPGKLITLKYSNAGESKPIVLVGKGVTFDTGGISLKSGASMDEMKYDMCGAAAVMGTILAVAEMKLNVNLVVVVPAVENMPSDKASKPGDVVKSMSGQTIEILNTDAEGRLILCDALTYCKKFNPEVVIDIATLTGAVIIALGKHHSGIMTNDKDLAIDLDNAGNTIFDTIWQLPLDEEYDELLKSNFADMANIGGKEAGTVTAACFLSRFAKDYRWAHLDIAGTAWTSGVKKGATGRPTPLLAQYIINKHYKQTL